MITNAVLTGPKLVSIEHEVGEMKAVIKDLKAEHARYEISLSKSYLHNLSDKFKAWQRGALPTSAGKGFSFAARTNMRSEKKAQ